MKFNIYLFKRVELAITSLLFLFIQCKSADINLNQINSYKGITTNEIESKAKIDKGRTYEIPFTIEKQEKCLNISITSIIFDTVFNKEEIVKTYFIVEKAIDISHYKNINSKKFALSEIGRNFNNNWEIKKEIVICSSDNDPIKKINKSLYRIRFTIFRQEDFRFKIKILSMNKIHFLNAYKIIE